MTLSTPVAEAAREVVDVAKQTAASSSLPATVRARISHSFLKVLLKSPEARAYVLTQASIAEATDEGAIFEHIAKHVDDPKLERMVRRHHEDEKRHAQLFAACAERQNVPPVEIPEHMRVIDNLNKHVGLFDKPIESTLDVMNAYLVLQVIEERAVEQFSQIAPVMELYDAKTAAIIRGIAEDENRHLRYCRAITKNYAPSEEVRVTRLKELREIEARSFGEHQFTNMAHMLDSGYLPRGATFLWRAISAILAKTSAVPFTRFHDEWNGESALAA